MENENGAVITLIILVVFAFLLLVAKFTEFIVRFNQETKYIVMEINRASDHNEYRYWRRELRCHHTKQKYVPAEYDRTLPLPEPILPKHSCKSEGEEEVPSFRQFPHRNTLL